MKSTLCKAKTKRGPCKRYSILGGVVCATHGGSAPQVKRAAVQRLQDLIDPDRSLREAARLAFSDLAEFYDANGEIKAISEWTQDMRAAVQAIETMDRDVTPGERGPAKKVYRLRLWDKPKNLEMLFKHLGLLEERIRADVEMNVRWGGNG